MEVIVGLLQLSFIVVMLGLLSILLICLLLSWTWAQHRSMEGKPLSFASWMSAAAVEWGAIVCLLASHLKKPKTVHYTPRFLSREDGAQMPPTQRPIVFVPSLHSSSRLFQFLVYRLRSNYFKSLWPLSLPSFLKDPELLVWDLKNRLLEVHRKTGSFEFHVVSFGSSRPLVAQALSEISQMYGIQLRWICLSGAAKISGPLQFLAPPRTLRIYESWPREERSPDLLVSAENDFFLYPDSIWGSSLRHVVVPDVGHFACLLHSATVQAILSELQSQEQKVS
jgi:hypothetical protein